MVAWGGSGSFLYRNRVMGGSVYNGWATRQTLWKAIQDDVADRDRNRLLRLSYWEIKEKLGLEIDGKNIALSLCPLFKCWKTSVDTVVSNRRGPGGLVSWVGRKSRCLRSCL